MVFSNLQLTVNKTRLKLYEKQKHNNAHTNCMGILRRLSIEEAISKYQNFETFTIYKLE